MDGQQGIAMSAWGTIELVGGGFALAAFLIAAVLAAYRARLSAMAKELLALPKDERARVLEVQREFFHIDASGLTRAQLEAIILEQIRARERRFRMGAILIGFSALMLALLTAYALSIDQKRVPPENATATVVGSLEGRWGSNIGVEYLITQSGHDFIWDVVPGKISMEKGRGKIVGSSVSASWSGSNGADTASGEAVIVDGQVTMIRWSNGVVFHRIE